MYSTRVQTRSQGRPTRDDVARRANTSGATVSRVLSGRTDIAILPETREKVILAAKELGYVPNNSARALTNGRTGIIGLWMSLAYSPYRGQVLNSMRSLLRGVEVTTAVTDIDEEYHFGHSFERALRVPSDGIIAFDTSATVEAFASNSDRLAPNLPFVSMGAYWSSRKSYVGIDLRKGTDAAMDHLISTGRRNIAYLAATSSDLIEAGPRYEGYISAVRNQSMSPQTIGVETFTYRHIQAVLQEMYDQRALPEAILCLNDEAALIASKVLQALGLKVGTDIAIVGFDGIEETEHASVPITTVRQPYEQMCQLAWEFLQSQVNDPTALPRQQILTPNLIIRESSTS